MTAADARHLRTIGWGTLAAITGLSKRTLQRYRAAGEIPPSAVVKYARAVRFRLDVIEQWMASRSEEP